MIWKQSLVTGICKKVSKLDPANHRPISLTCLCCNVMEHIILSHVAKHLSANNILLDSQHGFCEKLSSVTQLISSCHGWATTIQSLGQVDVVFLDCSKAFDKVLHQPLCEIVLLQHLWKHLDMDKLFPAQQSPGCYS